MYGRTRRLEDNDGAGAAAFEPRALMARGLVWWRQSNADYSMYSTLLTTSPGSVLFSRSNLLKRKDLCFSYLRVGLIRNRRSLRSSHLSSQVCESNQKAIRDHSSKVETSCLQLDELVVDKER
jgi:hypothetical protein